jgi:hypothetical protein
MTRNEKITIASLHKACDVYPSQWKGKLSDGTDILIRYRSSVLSVYLDKNSGPAFSIDLSLQREDGCMGMETDEMLGYLDQEKFEYSHLMQSKCAYNGACKRGGGIYGMYLQIGVLCGVCGWQQALKDWSNFSVFQSCAFISILIAITPRRIHKHWVLPLYICHIDHRPHPLRYHLSRR